MCFVAASLDGGSRIRRNVDKYLPHYTTNDGRSTILRNFRKYLYITSLKMEPAGSSETFVNIYQSTWRHIPEINTPHSHSCENIRSPKYSVAEPCPNNRQTYKATPPPPSSAGTIVSPGTQGQDVREHRQKKAYLWTRTVFSALQSHRASNICNVIKLHTT
jgi:hypothetical protein